MSTFKKIISMLLCIVMLTSPLTSCVPVGLHEAETNIGTELDSNHKHDNESGSDKEPDHTHVWSEWEVTLAATCTDTGEEIKSCACGEKVLQIIDAKGHSYTSVVTKPSCTNQGYTTHRCVCGAFYVDTYVDAVGHSYGDWHTVSSETCMATGTERRDCANCDHYEIRGLNATGHNYASVVTPPTCTEQGYTTYTCVCGASYVDAYVNAKGHAYGAWNTITAATCMATGTERRDCANCNHYEIRNVDATGHNYASVVTPPTCTEQGYTTHTCSCGASYVDAYTNAKGHAYGAWDTVTVATCVATGTERRDCANCDHYEIRGLDATGHTYTSVVTNPSCTNQGYTTHTCECGVYYVDTYVDAVGHRCGEWNTVIAETCVATGTERRDCANCDYYEIRSTEATGHTYTAVVTNPSCTNQGYTTHTCECGVYYVDTYVDAVGHSYGAWNTVTAETCVATGTERRDCANCDHYEIRSVDATGHNYASVVTPPTCTGQGYTTHTCECGFYYVDAYIEAVGHSFGDWYTVTSETCMTTGTERRDCTECNQYEARTLDAIGHTYTSVVSPSTCTGQGYTTHICECGFYYVDAYVEAVGHNFGDWVVITVPTCTDTGMERRDCENCDHYETGCIDATGHTYTSVVTDPSCANQGYTMHTCECGVYYVDAYVDEAEHVFGDWVIVIDSTCTVTGTERRDCVNCDHYETRSIDVIEHNYTSVVTDPTCTEQGYTTHTCKCGAYYVDTYVDALGHDEISHSAKEPSCTEVGWEAYVTCSRCDYNTYIEKGVLGHNTVSTTTPVTCIENGYLHTSCTACDYYTIEVVYATGHIITDYYLYDEPTCTFAGSYSGYCDNCDEYITIALSATGHTASELYFTNDYCGEQKLGYILCTICEETLAEFGHAYDESTVKATCTENGMKLYTCANCGDIYSETIVANGHMPGDWTVITSAGCTTEGQKGRYCITCDTLLESVEIASNGHSYVSAPTDGGITYTCSGCGDTYFVAVVSYVTLTFICGGEKICEDLQIAKGTYSTLPIPTLSGYYFDGWYLDAELTNKCLSTYTFASNTTLYGTWKQDSLSGEVDTNNLVVDVPLDYTFSVTSEVALTNSNLAKYLYVTDLNEASLSLYIVSESNGIYTIGSQNYEPGMTYQVLLRKGVAFTDTAGQELWFVIEKENGYNIKYNAATVLISQSSIYACYESDDKIFFFMKQDKLNPGDNAVIYGEDEYDVLLAVEVVAEGIYENLYVYQIDAADFDEVFDEYDLYYSGELDVENMEFEANLTEALTQQVMASSVYARFQYAAVMMAGFTVGDYYYDFNGITTKPSFSVKGTTVNFSIEIVAEFARMHVDTREVDALFHITLDVNSSVTFELTTQISSADNFVLAVEAKNTTKINLYASVKDDYNNKKELSYFKKFFDEAKDSGKFPAVDSNSASTQQELVLGVIPVQITCLTLSIKLSNVFDFEAVGKLGVGTQVDVSVNFGIKRTPDQGFSTIKSFKASASVTFYMLGKISVADTLKVEFNISLLGIVNAYINASVGPYFEMGGMLSATYSTTGVNSMIASGYLEIGVKVNAKVGANAKIKIWFFGTKTITLFDKEWTLYSQKFVLFSIGEKQIPIYFSNSKEELDIDYNCGASVNISTLVDTSVVVQDFSSMTTATEKLACEYYLNGEYTGVFISKNGVLTVTDDFEDGVISIKITCGNVYKIVDVTLTIAHNFVSVVHKDPTCTSNGNTAYTYCSVCSNVFEGENTIIDALGHSYSSVVTPQTCTTQGYTTHTCHCGHSYIDAYVQATGHNYQHVVTAPTCTERGYTTHTCSNCEESYVDTYVVANNHTDNGRGICSVCGSACDHFHAYTIQNTTSAYLVSNATCTVPAIYYYVCTCDAIGTETFESGDPLGHTYTDVITPPTCTAQGYTTHICHCGDSYTDSYVAILSHSDTDDNNLCDVCRSVCLAAGLYDANNKMIVSWDSLIKNYKMSVTATYTADTYQTATTSPYYLLTNKSTFASAVKLVIGDVDKIGDYAFYNCKMLTSIIIPNSVTSFGQYAFANCSGIKNITIPNSMTEISSRAFSGCSNLINVTIPDSITKIGSYAFYNCPKITSITLPDGLLTINGYAFAGCSSITSITIPDSVTGIAAQAFYYCKALTSVTLSNNLKSIGIQLFRECTALTSIIIPESVRSIGNQAFLGCSNLQSIIIPESVTSVGGGAFDGCSSLKSIIIPNSVTTIGGSAFSGCNSLESITLPFIGARNSTESSEKPYLGYLFGAPDVESQKDYVPTSLKTVVISGSTDIGHRAFYDCQNITSVIMCDGVTRVGDGAFYNCTGLISIIIPDSVIFIGADVFVYCTNLRSVTFGTGIVIANTLTMRSRVFYKCQNLTTINFTGTMAQWKSICRDDGLSFAYDIATDKVICTDGTVSIVTTAPA